MLERLSIVPQPPTLSLTGSPLYASFFKSISDGTTKVKRFKPQLVAIRNESLISELKEALFDCEHKPEIIPGEEGVVEVARHPDAVTVVTGIVGCAGLKG